MTLEQPSAIGQTEYLLHGRPPCSSIKTSAIRSQAHRRILKNVCLTSEMRAYQNFAALDAKTLLEWLEPSPKNQSWKELNPAFAQLKILSRDKNTAQALYTNLGISRLIEYAFDKLGRGQIWQAAAKACLANAMTLEPSCRMLFHELHGLKNIFAVSAKEVGSCPHEDEFLIARILFLATAQQDDSVLEELGVHRQELTELLKGWYGRHSSAITSPFWPSDQSASAFKETLKLLYNMSLADTALFRAVINDTWSTVLTVIADLLKATQSAQQILELAHHNVNLLINIQVTRPMEEHDFECLWKLLKLELETYTSNRSSLGASDDHLISLFTALSNIYLNLTLQDTLREHFQHKLLVPDDERDMPLGRSQSLGAQLLAYMNVASPRARECLSGLLYQISGSDPAKFSENIGYGHAIGFLTSHGIALPPASIPQEHNTVEINPITGQTRSSERADQRQRNLPEMSDEEKEREAEKLFVLFQRLKKNGVIQVEDPIQRAVDEGRFEEM